MKLFDILFESDMRKVSLAVLIYDNKVLILKRTAGGSNPLKWGFPGGGIDSGETALEAVLRECEEEIGVRPIGVRKLSQNGRITWFVGELPTAPEECISLDYGEHSDWEMVGKDDLDSYDMIDGMRELIVKVLEG